jgi:hypothetical protein
MGSIISQPQKIGYDGYFTALSTTNVSTISPDANPSSYPNAAGVYPSVKDVALIGRDNTDVILKEKQIQIRVGKHVIDNVLALNKENPAFIQMDFFAGEEKKTMSTSVTMADKIALLSHDGTPKFKTNNLDQDEINRIFNEAHPLLRGDLAVQAFEMIRNAIVQHIHGYNGLAADPAGVIVQLQKIDFNKLLQPNIRIN